MLETAFKSSVDVAKVKMSGSGVQLDVVSKTVPLYDSFETQHHGKRDVYYVYESQTFRPTPFRPRKTKNCLPVFRPRQLLT